MAGQSLSSRVAYWVARSFVVGFCRRVDPHDHRGQGRTSRRRAPTSSLRSTARTWTRRSPRASPAGGCGSWARTRSGRRRFPAWALSTLGGFPVSRGTYDFEAMKRCLEVLRGRRAARAVPRRRAQERARGAAAVRRRRLPRAEGERADRAGRHRRLRAGHAEGLEDDLPPQGARGRGRAAPARRARQRAGAARAGRRADRASCTPACRSSSTRPRPWWSPRLRGRNVRERAGHGRPARPTRPCGPAPGTCTRSVAGQRSARPRAPRGRPRPTPPASGT